MNQKLQITNLKLQRFQRALEQSKFLNQELDRMESNVRNHIDSLLQGEREIDPNELALHNYIMNRSPQSPLEKSFRDFL